MTKKSFKAAENMPFNHEKVAFSASKLKKFIKKKSQKSLL